MLVLQTVTSKPFYGVRASGVGSLGSVSTDAFRGQGCLNAECKGSLSDPFFCL